MISADCQQKIMIGAGIFLSLTAVGFSFEGRQANWFWQKAPVTASALLLLAFGLVRYWLFLEIKKQKNVIRQAFELQKNGAEENLSTLLSTREREVLALILAGKSNKSIADTLFVAPSTVKTHINNIYRMLEVKNRREAIEKLR